MVRNQKRTHVRVRTCKYAISGLKMVRFDFFFFDVFAVALVFMISGFVSGFTFRSHLRRPLYPALRASAGVRTYVLRTFPRQNPFARGSRSQLVSNQRPFHSGLTLLYKLFLHNFMRDVENRKIKSIILYLS